VGLPEKAERASILRVHARGRPFSPEVDFDDLAERTAGFSGAELERLVREAAMQAMRELLIARDNGANTAELSIERRHVEAARAAEHQNCRDDTRAPQS
jgi:SpoVK/Ycf46/Vps4 family AAA+-type ATPase